MDFDYSDISPNSLDDICPPNPNSVEVFSVDSDSDSSFPFHMSLGDSPSLPLLPPTLLDSPASLFESPQAPTPSSPPQAAPSKASKSRDKPYDPVVFRWCFTLNNPGNFRPCDLSCVNYMIFQLEKGKEGTPHLQGYVRFVQKKRLSAVKNAWHDTPMNTAHWEPARYPERVNHDYCSKSKTHLDGPWEHKPQNYKESSGVQGHRSDLDAVLQTIDSGASFRTIATSHPIEWIKYNKGLQSYATVTKEPEDIRTDLRQVSVEILFGPTNTGKTFRTFHKYKGECYFVKPGRDPWGNYEYEPIIIFDEFDPEQWSIQKMNDICDVYPCKLDCRYQDKFLAATKVIIIANSHPHQWWFLARRALQNAFFRRITCAYNITKRKDDPEWTEEQPIFIEQIEDQFNKDK